MSRYLGIIEATPEFYKGCMENPQDDLVSVEALSMAICASGIMIKSRLVPILNSAEAVSAMKKAREIAYSPPSSS